MRFVRHGVTRDVLLVGRWAIKFPNTRYHWQYILEGWLANRKEAATWYGYSNSVDEESKAEARKLCPVVRSCLGGLILVMRRAEPFEGTLSTFHVPSFVKDIKTDNFGILNGQVVCLD